MATTLTEVNDLFLSRISDFRLDTIFTASGSLVLNTYLEPWLIDSIVDFDICNQTLNYTPTSGSADGTFDIDLNLKNKVILSRIMVLYWLKKNVNDILQMNNSLQDRDFKTFAQANNLNAKREYLNMQREEISQMLTEYGFANNNWTDWRNQNFAP
jgi:hypothetical protein